MLSVFQKKVCLLIDLFVEKHDIFSVAIMGTSVTHFRPKKDTSKVMKRNYCTSTMLHVLCVHHRMKGGTEGKRYVEKKNVQGVCATS